MDFCGNRALDSFTNDGGTQNKTNSADVKTARLISDVRHEDNELVEI